MNTSNPVSCVYAADFAYKNRRRTVLFYFKFKARVKTKLLKYLKTVFKNEKNFSELEKFLKEIGLKIEKDGTDTKKYSCYNIIELKKNIDINQN